MDKEKIIEILEDYEFFCDDDYGGHYEHIDCSQRALTPLGIVGILDYISELEQQCKKQQEIINEAIKKVDILRRNYAENVCQIPCTEIEDIDRTLKEVSR